MANACDTRSALLARSFRVSRHLQYASAAVSALMPAGGGGGAAGSAADAGAPKVIPAWFWQFIANWAAALESTSSRIDRSRLVSPSPCAAEGVTLLPRLSAAAV